MTKKITKNFAVHNARQFVESIDEQSNSIYYVFGGRHITWPDENNPPEITDSLEDTYYQLYRDMMFGKKVSPSDMKHMIENNAWDTTGNTVYSKYDNRADTLTNFFVVTINGAKHDVFKCLDNNKGSKSTVKPTFVSGSSCIKYHQQTIISFQQHPRSLSFHQLTYQEMQHLELLMS